MKHLTFVFLLVLAPCIALADWQSDLEAQFDYVETFDDNTGAWKGDATTASKVTSATTDPCTLINDASQFSEFSGNSIEWSFYYLPNTLVGSDNWIDDFGTDYRWTSGNAGNATNHRSFRIDYGPTYRGQRGASEIGFKVGTAPSDGYSEVYMFFMQKYPSNTFIVDSSGNLEWHGFQKEVVISAGFKDVNQWGTDAEQSSAQACNASSQARCEYGFTWNIPSPRSTSGGGAGLGKRDPYGYFQNFTDDPCNYYGEETSSLISFNNNVDFKTEYLAGEWIGVEIYVKMADPAGSSTGVHEISVYDQDGNLLGTDTISGLMNFDDNGNGFNHKLNKFKIGGNSETNTTYCTRYAYGTHDGGTSSTLSDSTADFSTEGFTTADYVHNMTDGSQGQITAQTSTTISATLLRGSDNQWENGDDYVVSSNDCLPSGEWYIDDIIINDTEIAPTYFSLLNGSSSGNSLSGSVGGSVR